MCVRVFVLGWRRVFCLCVPTSRVCPFVRYLCSVCFSRPALFLLPELRHLDGGGSTVSIFAAKGRGCGVAQFNGQRPLLAGFIFLRGQRAGSWVRQLRLGGEGYEHLPFARSEGSSGGSEIDGSGLLRLSTIP